MADTAAHLVERVLPHAPVRQWARSFPYLNRFLLASSPRLCAAVRGILTRTLLANLHHAVDDDRLRRKLSAWSSPSGPNDGRTAPERSQRHIETLCHGPSTWRMDRR